MSYRKKSLLALLSFLLAFALVESAARVVWWHRAQQAFDATREHAKELLRTDIINYMKEPDGLYFYVLKRNFAQGGMVVNGQGFAQRDEVPLARSPGKLRLVALGESTTQGNDVDRGNYPEYLRRLLAAREIGHQGVEMINAGVMGWYSDQVALRAEHQLAAYQPDIAILMVGWVDFVAYNPFGGIPKVSAFETHLHGSKFHRQAGALLKSVAVLSALAQKYWTLDVPRALPAPPKDPAPEDLYRFFLKSMEQTVAVLRQDNPQLRIAVCTLVGRWPQMTEEEYASDSGRTYWMKDHGVSQAQAVERLARFNTLIRHFAARHGLVLIDLAAACEPLNRAHLQWDFCHMHHEGNELLAELMYDALRQAGAIQGSASPRLDELLASYRLSAESGSAPE